MKTLDWPVNAGRLCAALAAVHLCVSPATGARRPERPSTDLEYEALPLERSQQNHLLVRAFINGKPALLGVDSGAPVSAIAIQRRQHFGLKPLPGGSTLPLRLNINGAFNSVGVAHTLRLGALTLLDEPMVAIDLSNSSKAARAQKEQEIDGILGADILLPTKAVLDCQAQLLVLKMDPQLPGPIPGFDFRGFRGVPLRVSAGYNLYVDGTINGHAAKLMVDTGAFTTLLHRRFVRRMKIPLRETPFNTAGVNLKERGVEAATIQRLSIGTVNFRKKDVGVMDLQGLIHDDLLDASPPVVGLLGSEILRRHHGIIDFGTRMLYLKP